MKNLLKDLYNHKIMSREEAKSALFSLTDGSTNASQISSFLTVFLMRDTTSEELDGFREAMIELSLDIDIEGDELIDLCGTGGDAKDTFNISTLSSFVVAGAGLKVSKHGNYGVSSSCGSSNVISYLGHKFSNDVDSLKNSLNKSNICFLHAPLFHPSLKNISPIRGELGVKTFFNMLGPMVNPIQPKSQLVGVFNSNTFRLYSHIYSKTDKNYCIVHSIDGYDEVSLTGAFKLFSNDHDIMLEPKDLGFSINNSDKLSGGKNIEESSKIFLDILKNNGTKEQVNTVLANSGLAIYCAKKLSSIKEGIEIARESLESGNAYNCLKLFIENK
ncbi:MAG: anthranilate phosphoribosyltransferase [Cytophagales bacterium]|nr:anthranilate phosphoribosyltransferase [Marinoscillum sp.]OUX26190.1 MAG: anthranilate phosphoribosyltransferase [Flammeovirgaceae bacterium TMED262]|tara:strand:+ start:8980 stop:9972 length:993 start_codon:yes stop_codon:yes gene_type:complete